MHKPDQTRPYVKPEYPQSEITGRIIAAAQQVHRTLGPGFEEVIYQRALALELPGAGQRSHSNQCLSGSLVKCCG